MHTLLCTMVIQPSLVKQTWAKNGTTPWVITAIQSHVMAAPLVSLFMGCPSNCIQRSHHHFPWDKPIQFQVAQFHVRIFPPEEHAFSGSETVFRAWKKMVPIVFSWPLGFEKRPLSESRAADGPPSPTFRAQALKTTFAPSAGCSVDRLDPSASRIGGAVHIR